MRDRSNDWLAALAAIGGLALGLVAYRLGGFVAMALLGLLMSFVAVRLDLEKDDVGGGFPSPHLYARQISVRETMSRAERVAREATLHSLWRPLVVAKTVGIALAVCGIGGFLLLD